MLDFPLGNSLSSGSFSDFSVKLEKPFEDGSKSRVIGKCDHRGEQITSLFLEKEAWAKDDWVQAMKHLSSHELANLEPDFVIRAIRSSGFMAQPERRKKRNLQLLKSLVRWRLGHKVDKVFSLCRGESMNVKRLKYISPARVEQFRSLVLPLKLYGFSRDKNPIVKFSLKESNWKEATKLFRDSVELKYLLILSLESLFRKIQALGCRAGCSDDSVFVTGKYVLIADVEGLNIANLRSGYSLQIYRIVQMIWKYYPETVLKVYVINSKYCKNASQLLAPFVPKRIIKRMKFFANERNLLENLTEVDGVEISQIPVEYGGNFEGRYVVDVSID